MSHNFKQPKKLTIEWNTPVSLVKLRPRVYSCNLEQIPDWPGIYIFERMHGEKSEALYVGKANNLRQRVKSQLQNTKLMDHIENAKNGQKLLTWGFFKAKPGQRVETFLPMIEKVLIQNFLLKGHSLANVQHTAPYKYCLESEWSSQDISCLINDIPPELNIQAPKNVRQ